MLSLEKDLYRIAKLRLKENEDICDAVQETMLIAFESINKLKQVQYFKTWITKILINQTNQIYRKKNKRKIVPFDELEKCEMGQCFNIENAETSLNFNFMCKNLQYEDRTIIILYYLERFTDKEIGKILDLKESTVTTKRTRAKQKIRDILEKGEKSNGQTG